MRHKFLIKVTLVLSVLVCALGLFACGNKTGGDDNPDVPSSQHTTHSYVASVIEPTCVDQGYTSHKCECGDEYKDNYKDPTGKHNYGTYEYNNDATCVADGTESATCRNCTHVDTRVKTNTATGVHSYGEYTYNNDATCVADGTESAKCKYCNRINTVAKIGSSATGAHSYLNYYCSACDSYELNYLFTEGLWYDEVEEGSSIIAYTLKGVGTATDTDIIIPKYYKGKPVTSIGTDAFWDCSSLTSITIPNSVTSIGGGAFWDCSSLTSIEIPSSVTSIGNNAFQHCDSLTTIEIPNSVTSIGSWAFYGCSKLTTIRFDGTKAQWMAIGKGSSWYPDNDIYIVICTDGTL